MISFSRIYFGIEEMVSTRKTDCRGKVGGAGRAGNHLKSFWSRYNWKSSGEKFFDKTLPKTSPQAILKASVLLYLEDFRWVIVSSTLKNLNVTESMGDVRTRRPNQTLMGSLDTNQSAGDEPSRSAFWECDEQVFPNAHVPTEERAPQQASISNI